jgi:predicted DNA-binding protein with PD1-like motif
MLRTRRKQCVAEGKVGRIIFSRISENDDLIAAVKTRAKEKGVNAGFFMLIGSLKNAVVGYYRDRKYERIKLDGPLEIVSCMGNVAVDESNEVIIHSHLVVSNEKGEAFGGHLMEGSYVGVTAELIMVEATDVELKRVFDEKANLKLWKLH